MELETTRQTLVQWRKLPGAPQERDVVKWKAFVEQNQLGKRLSGSALRDEETRHKIELLKSKIDREQRRVIDREEVNRLLLHVSTDGRTVLYQLMESELPPKLDGMAAAQMRPILREAADSIADRMAGLIERYKENG